MSATPTSGRLPKDSDVCSVCLSPFQSFFVEETKDFDENNLPIVTKCKVIFYSVKNLNIISAKLRIIT